jgi:hypothetical protein
VLVNRTRELAWLGECHGSGKAELLVLYGRRRAGKSALLAESCRGRPRAYFLASQARESDNLDQVRGAFAVARPDPLLDSLRFSSWETALTYAAQGERNTAMRGVAGATRRRMATSRPPGRVGRAVLDTHFAPKATRPAVRTEESAAPPASGPASLGACSPGLTLGTRKSPWHR